MSLVRFNNYRAGFPTVFNRVFHDDFLGSPLKQNLKHAPAVNVKEDENAFGIELAAPGFNKEDFKVELNAGHLVISAEVKSVEEDKKEKYTRKEFKSQSFRRMFTLPESIDTEVIEANYENGILYVNLPKKEAEVEQKKEIVIQ